MPRRSNAKVQLWDHFGNIQRTYQWSGLHEEKNWNMKPVWQSGSQDQGKHGICVLISLGGSKQGPPMNCSQMRPVHQRPMRLSVP